MITFILGERILCFHGPLIYDAKCLKVRKTNGIDEYLIHYAGWNKALVVYVVVHKEKFAVQFLKLVKQILSVYFYSWDEWVTDLRVLKYNEQNLARQRELLKAQ